MAQLEDIELPEGDAPNSIHINPASKFWPNILLPGDPARAMAIATDQLTAPRMFNHRRGLWGYSGETAAGTGVLIQSTGMGGPSAAIVCEELCDLGAEILVRVGTCGAIDPSLKLGDLLVVDSAIATDGASRALGAKDPLRADAQLRETLAEHAAAGGRRVHVGTIATVDLFYDPAGAARGRELAGLGALAVEMETAAIFAVAARRGVRAACLLGVTDELGGESGDRLRMPHDDVTKLGSSLGNVAIAALEEAASEKEI